MDFLEKTLSFNFFFFLKLWYPEQNNYGFYIITLKSAILEKVKKKKIYNILNLFTLILNKKINILNLKS